MRLTTIGITPTCSDERWKNVRLRIRSEVIGYEHILLNHRSKTQCVDVSTGPGFPGDPPSCIYYTRGITTIRHQGPSSDATSRLRRSWVSEFAFSQLLWLLSSRTIAIVRNVQYLQPSVSSEPHDAGIIGTSCRCPLWTSVFEARPEVGADQVIPQWFTLNPTWRCRPHDLLVSHPRSPCCLLLNVTADQFDALVTFD